MSSPEPYPFAFYRALHRGTEGDVDFYRRVASGAGSVLELGAGDGRIARAIAADGLEVTALEASAEAVEAGRRGHHGDRVTWVVGTMERFDLGRTFDRIIAPYNAIYCLTTKEAQAACFSCAARHLSPSGYFVFDAWSADAFHAEAEEGEPGEPEWVDEVVVEGRRYRVLESTRWDRRAQFLDVTYRYEPVEGGEPVVARIPQRYLLVTEIEAMLAEAGLELVVVHGGFDQHVWDEDSERIVVTATK